jgi:Cft2 family RNA processing exonuclease
MQDYMRWAREKQMRGPAAQMPASIREFTGHTGRRREERQSKQQRAFRQVLREVARDDEIRPVLPPYQWGA